MTVKGQHRHGDVALIPTLISPPPDAKRVTRLVLAEGEVTGHAHVLTGDILVWEVGGQRYVHVQGTGTLTHEDHGVQVVEPLPEGRSHRAMIQREYAPTEERRVLD